MHVPVFPVVLTVQDFPPGLPPEGVGLGLTVLGEVDGVGRPLAPLEPLGPLGLLGLPGFSMSQGRQRGLLIGMEADWCSKSVKSPKQR